MLLKLFDLVAGNCENWISFGQFSVHVVEFTSGVDPHPRGDGNSVPHNIPVEKLKARGVKFDMYEIGDATASCSFWT